MTDLEELVQDLRAHAHEAPVVCAALMRRAAAELEQRGRIVAIVDRVRARAPRSSAQSGPPPAGSEPSRRHQQVKGAPCD
jgi:hypothetical protein